MNLDILYEDNHLIVVNKPNNIPVQGDSSGDKPLLDYVKEYIKVTYNKPGEVYLGLVHRIDRPVSGLVIFARTSKALTRMNKIFKDHDLEKKYWAIVKPTPSQKQATLVHYLTRDTKKNKSFCYTKEVKDSKRCELDYEVLVNGDNFSLLEINLKTGRHHQIRAQLSAIGSIIRGDLKYNAKRSNPGGGIDLHARSVTFIHPVKKETVHVVAPVPDHKLWHEFESKVKRSDM